MKITIARCAIAIVAACMIAIGAAAIMSDTYDVRLGAHRFAIPKQYSLEGRIPSWLRAVSGLDDGSRSYLLKIPAQEVAKNVPGYKSTDGKLDEDVEFVLNVLNDVEIRRYADSGRFRDLWYATESYADRVVEPYENRSLFRVFRNTKHKHSRDSWAVTRISPQSDISIPRDVFDFWIAHCLAGDSPITLSGRYVSCRSYVFYGDISIEFSVSEQNLDVIDQVRDFLKSQVELWQVAN
jgi:hypothetical protein